MAGTTSNRIRLIGLLPLVALAVGYVAGRYRSADAIADAASTAPSVQSAAPATSARLAPLARLSSAPPRAMPALPSDGVPLAESFDALASRARAGDVGASLRLFREVRHCQERAMLESISGAPPMQPDINALPDSIRERVLADVHERERRRDEARGKLAASESACTGVTASQIMTLGEWLERAADGGDAGAAACYVVAGTSDAYVPAERYSDAWVEWMKRYRAKAHEYAEFAFAHGYQEAAWYLYWVAAGPYAMPAFQIDHDIPRDYARAYAIALLQAKLIDRGASRDTATEMAEWRKSAERLSVNLDASAIASANAWAEREATRLAAHPPPEPCSDGTNS
jgi:hypothetical protein